MKRSYYTKKLVLLTAVAGVLLSITGCEFLHKYLPTTKLSKCTTCPPAKMSADKAPVKPEEAKNFSPNDPVVVRIEGKPVMRKSEYITFANQAIKANPYLANFGMDSYDKLPSYMKERMLEAAMQQKLIEEWGRRSKMSDNSEYQQALEKTVEQVKQALTAQAFDKEILESVAVAADEVVSEYERNKKRYIKTPEKFQISGVKFDDDDREDAEKLLEKANKPSVDFVALVEDEGEKVRKLGEFSKDPRVPGDKNITPAMKRALFGAHDDDYALLVKDEDDIWVIHIDARDEAVYFDLDEIREQISMGLRGEKFRAERDKLLAHMKTEYTATLDSSSLEEKKEKTPEAPRKGGVKHEVRSVEDLQKLIKKVEKESEQEAPEEHADLEALEKELADK